MWDLPGPGLEPVSPALAGRFLTTAPPGKIGLTLVVFLPDMVSAGSWAVAQEPLPGLWEGVHRRKREWQTHLGSRSWLWIPATSQVLAPPLLQNFPWLPPGIYGARSKSSPFLLYRHVFLPDNTLSTRQTLVFPPMQLKGKNKKKAHWS